MFASYLEDLPVCVIYTIDKDYVPLTLVHTCVSYLTPLSIHTPLSNTPVLAFAESPGVRLCHADYALGP